MSRVDSKDPGQTVDVQSDHGLHCPLTITIYWKIPISVLGMSGYVWLCKSVLLS